MAGPSNEVPCNIANPPKQKIILHGEVHENAISDADIKAQEKKSAAKSQITAEEGLFYDHAEKKTNVVGLESQFPYGLGALMRIDMELNSSASVYSTYGLKVLTVDSLTENPYTREAWQRMRKEKELPNKDEERLAKIIDQGLAHKKISAADEEFLEAESTSAAASFDALVKDLGRSYVDMAKSPKYRTQMQVPPDIDLALDSFNGKNQILAIHKVVIDWRNISIRQNLASLYCRAQAENEDIVVTIGAGHLEDLAANLNKIGLPTEIAGFSSPPEIVGFISRINSAFKKLCSRRQVAEQQMSTYGTQKVQIDPANFVY